MSNEEQTYKDFTLELQRWEGFLSVFQTAPPPSDLTPRQAIWKKNKTTLWYYPAKEKTYSIPLFLVYSIVNQPFMLDFAPGSSLIESYTNEGYDVYLIDFGVPGYEDKDFTMTDYITRYIQKGVQKALKHAQTKTITLIGYCLGGTLAAMYAAIAEEPIKNLILTVAPFDFSSFPIFDKWLKALKNEQLEVEDLIDTIGLIPASLVEAGVRLIAAPVYFSPYLSLLNRAHDKDYVERWQRFNNWTKSHIPFPGAALKQMLNEMVIKNGLMTGEIDVDGKLADLHNIKSNLLVISSKYDRLVPVELIRPIMDVVSSEDKTFIQLEGGHAGLSLKGGIPDYLKTWLHERSEPKETNDLLDNEKQKDW